MSMKSNINTYWRTFEEIVNEKIFAYALIVPATIVVLSVIMYPLLQAIWMSFFDVSFLNPMDRTFIGLENYRAMLHDESLRMAARNTVILTVVTVTLQFILGLGLALLLNQQLPGMKWIRTSVLLAWVTPLVVIVVLFDWANHPDFGLINIILSMFGLPTSYWLGSTTWALPMVIFMHVWNATPFFAIVFLAALQSIPSEFYEAAKMDGASSLAAFRHITLPHLSYVSMILIVLYVIAWFNAFTIVYVGTGGGPLQSTELLATYVYKQAFEAYALGYAAAIGTVVLLLLMIFTIVYVKLEGREQ